MDGLFYGYDLVSQGTFSTSEPRFYRFFPNGYVFDGVPEGDPADIDCTRTKPNGAPFCDTYQVSSGLIRIEDSDPVPFSLDGAVPILDGEALTPVAANTVTSLDGTLLGERRFLVRLLRAVFDVLELLQRMELRL